MKSLATLMTREPGRWPRPVGRVRIGTTWAMTYDLDELLAVAAPQPIRGQGRPFRGAATVSDEVTGLIVCALCGVKRRSLTQHIRGVHGLTSVEYREATGLPATAALIADVSRDAMRSRGREKFEAGQLDHLEQWNQGEHLQEMTRRGRSRVSASWDNSVSAAHRLPGQRKAVQVMQRS